MTETSLRFIPILSQLTDIIPRSTVDSDFDYFLESKYHNKIFIFTQNIDSSKIKPTYSSLCLYDQTFYFRRGQYNEWVSAGRNLIFEVDEMIYPRKGGSLRVSVGTIIPPMRDARTTTIIYKENIGGFKQECGDWSTIDAGKRRVFMDLTRIHELPECIDVRKTAVAFIEQVKARNFGRPQLILP
jgi:hypothetical protein